MKKHLFVTVVLAGIFGFSVLAAGQTQLDIALEGPWVLFTDTIDANAVLVAVAPINTTATGSVGPHSHFHHRPQISSGNGFYIPSHGIFCLAFDRRCAPSAGSAPPKRDPGYPPEKILTVTGTTASKVWRSYGTNNVVVILPMPNLYHADGVWPMEFLYDHSLDHIGVAGDSYSIGLILHYNQAATRLRLYSCTGAVTSVTTDCLVEAQDDKKHLIEVTNTGTVRLQMRAPDTNDNCDHHVRYAFHQILYMLDPKDPTYNDYKGHRYIEPAIGLNPDDTGIFETSKGKHPCFDDDPSDQDDPLTGTLHPAATTQETPVAPTDPFAEALEKIKTQWPSKEPLLDKNELFKAAQTDFNQATELEGSLRISDVRRMGALTEQSAHEIRIVIAELRLESVRSENLNVNDEIDTVSKLEKLRRALKVFADGTKNGADCRAAQVLVQ